MNTKLKKTKKIFHLTDNERMLMKKYYHNFRTFLIFVNFEK